MSTRHPRPHSHRLDGAFEHHPGSELWLAVFAPPSVTHSVRLDGPFLSFCVAHCVLHDLRHLRPLSPAAMQLNYLAPFQAVARTKNQFALFFVAFFVAKLLHLGSHAGSLPIVLYVLYTPTFFLPDVFLLVSSKVLVYRLNGGQSSAIRKFFGGLLA